MTTETQQFHAHDGTPPIPFGTRLQTAREALGLDRKDAASQLRLSEKVITMMEKGKYSSDLPVTFIRGYIRAYGKFLQIPEAEVKHAVEPIQPTPPETAQSVPSASQFKNIPAPRPHYFMQIFTYIILLTMIGLAAMWWFSKSKLESATTIKSMMPQENHRAVPAESIGNTSAAEAIPVLLSEPAPMVPAHTAPVAKNDNEPTAYTTSKSNLNEQRDDDEDVYYEDER